MLIEPVGYISNAEMASIAFVGLIFVILFFGLALIVAWLRRDQFRSIAVCAVAAAWMFFGGPMLLALSAPTAHPSTSAADIRTH